MTDNTKTIKTILQLVEAQNGHTASIPQMRKDISKLETGVALINSELSNQSRRLSDVPTDTEVELKISDHAVDCLKKVEKAAASSSRRRGRFTWPMAATIILGILAALAAYWGG